jgi:hypothetical protein
MLFATYCKPIANYFNCGYVNASSTYTSSAVRAAIYPSLCINLEKSKESEKDNLLTYVFHNFLPYTKEENQINK